MKELSYPFDSKFILKYKKKLKKQLLSEDNPRIPLKIAVLCGSTANDIVAALELFLLNFGIEPKFYISEYNKYWEDAVFSNDELNNFSPNIVFIHTTHRNITEFSNNVSDSQQIDNLNAQLERFKQMWNAISERFKCPIIQNNFELPLCRNMGNSDSWHYNGLSNFINQLNCKFSEYARNNDDFFINDINYLSAKFGLEKWHDFSYWYLFKYAMSFDAIPSLAYNISCIIKSLYGKNKKLIALDLDNTLWGGIIGDDGIEGIEIGEETASAEAFSDFQNFIKSYKSLGVVLGVCSKNESENAVLGLSHPDSVLSPDDFASIKANWNSKDVNLEEMALELNLLPESFVFVDDNPAECNIVSSQIPEISVVGFEKIQDAMIHLSNAGYFEITRFSDDDVKRNEMYATNAKRISQIKNFANYTEYLLSLDMYAVIQDFLPVNLQRITQLTNKSNQFNLTTKRYSDSDMLQVFNSENHIRLYGKLCDKFGDNGIVSVVIGEKNGDYLHIDLWLMSCRVLKRDMEYAMLDSLVLECKRNNISFIVGYYFKTKKNNMVANLFCDFGFTKIKQYENGDSVWKLNINDYTNKNNVIKIFESECANNG